jgi:16S rRNA processing protein RimM
VRLLVARIGRAHGVRGSVTVESRTDAPAARFVPGTELHVSDGARRTALTSAGLPTTLTVTGAREHGGTIRLTFAEIADRTTAEQMRDVLLEADVPDVSDESDAWYDHELVGLRVTDTAGTGLGEVVGVQHLPGQDLLVVRRPSGEDRMVPFVHAIVPEVDMQRGQVVLDPPAGLLD